MHAGTPCRSATAFALGHDIIIVSRPKVAPLSHDTNFCIATHSWPGHARTLSHAPRAGRPCRRPCRGLIRPYRRRARSFVAMSWLTMHALVLLCHAMSRYSLLYRDQAWVLGSSQFFFHFFPPTGRAPKKYLFFIFSFFTYCKTPEKLSSTHFFFSSPVASWLLLKMQ